MLSEEINGWKFEALPALNTPTNCKAKCPQCGDIKIYKIRRLWTKKVCDKCLERVNVKQEKKEPRIHYSTYKGKKFNRLKVIEIFPTTHKLNKSKKYVECTAVCNCGKTVHARLDALVCGHRKSCGCLRLETVSQLGTRTYYDNNHDSYKKHKWVVVDIFGEHIADSGYETVYSMVCIKNKIPIVFHPITYIIKTPSYITYTPDFGIVGTDVIVETKGYFPDNSKDKLDKFVEEFNINLEFVHDKEILILLGMGYTNFINIWTANNKNFWETYNIIEPLLISFMV